MNLLLLIFDIVAIFLTVAMLRYCYLSLIQLDTCIEVGIQKQKEHLSVELSKIDARIMRNVSGIKQLEAKIGPLCAPDFGLIVVLLVKSYLRAHIENLAEKDATEKSDAAREAFLAELALDSKKKDWRYFKAI